MSFLQRCKLCGLLVLSISLGACGSGTSNDTSDDESTGLIVSSNSSLQTSQNSSSTPASSIRSSSQSSQSILFSSSSTSVTKSSLSSSNRSFVPVMLQSEINRVQPMTGIVFWSENNSALNALGDDVQLEFSYMLYRDVVTTLGTYNWDLVDTKLAEAAGRGHQIIFRFRDTYPGVTATSIPNGLPSSISQVEGKNTFIPDWSSIELQEFILDFFTKFAERYDNDPRLAFIQVGFGSYSEYHLYDGNLVLGQTFPSKGFQTTFLNHIANKFSKTPWTISIDAANSNHSPFSSSASLKNLAFGLFDDSFMHKDHSLNDSEYNRESWLFFGINRYQTSPAGGEFSYYTAYDQAHVLDTNGAHNKSFEEFARQYSITYMIGNDQFEHQTRARIKAASLATGYAFRVTKLESNGETVRMSIRNEGIAPIYYDAYPSVNNQRATQSLKGLLPNSTREVEITIDEHNPRDITLKIESDRLVPTQVIQFKANL